MAGQASRDELLRTIRDHPGLHLRGLERELPWSFGRLRHHLDQLQRRGLVRSESSDGYLRYFAADVPPDLRTAAAALRQRQMRRILAVLLEQPGLGVVALAERLDLAPSTVSTYARRLRAMGLVEAMGRDLAVRNPDSMRTALAAIRPSALDRLVDSALAVFDDADRART